MGNKQNKHSDHGPPGRGNPTPRSPRPYGDYSYPLEKKSSPLPMVIFGITALFPIVAMVYYVSKTEVVSHPVVEKYDTPISDLLQQPDSPTTEAAGNFTQNEIRELPDAEPAQEQKLPNRVAVGVKKGRSIAAEKVKAQ